MEHEHPHHHGPLEHTHPIDPEDPHHQSIDLLGDAGPKGTPHRHHHMTHTHVHTHDDPHHAHDHRVPPDEVA